jgi:alkyl hydroperoxide reductase subunit AhpC
MFPHERSLVKRLENRPFALIGVNSDPDLEKLKEQNKNQQITWRSFWDQTTSGPIAKQYRVQGWPTIYVLDENGVIRARNVRDQAMDRAVDDLLAEMDAKKK